MKKWMMVLSGMTMLMSLFLVGCGDDNSSSPTTPGLESGTAAIEGQLVADVGTQFAQLTTAIAQSTAAGSPTVYPVSGATVELLQNGTVIATSITDEYGRFQFTNLAPGDYEVRTVAQDGSVARYHVTVSADQTLTVYGRVMSGDCLWSQELGPHWDDMPQGRHWGSGFAGASPGQGCWHDGTQWCDPVGTGPHGPHYGNP